MTFPTVAVGDQWSGAAYTTETDMHNRIDVPLNAMADEMRTWGHGFARFIATKGAGAQAVNTNILFTAVEDTAAGYNAATGVYTIGQTGLWIIGAQVVQSTALTMVVTILGLPAAWHAPISEASDAANFGGADLGNAIDLTAGTQLSVQLQAASAPTLIGPASGTPSGQANTGNSPRNYFTAMMVAHR